MQFWFRKGFTHGGVCHNLGDVVYYFTERKEDQSFTEPAEKGRGNEVEATKEEASVSKDIRSWKDRRA